MTSPITVTTLPYTGTTQVASVAGTYGIPVTAHIWGAGGGSSAIFSGAGGGYSQVQFVAKPGDTLTVAIGQGGGAGGNAQYSYTPVGQGGASYIGTFFNTRFPPAQDSPVYPYGNGDTFLGQYGVWGADPRATSFTRTYVINFPTTANVIFQMVASIYGRVYLDSNLVVEGAGYLNNTINQASLKITAGTHVLTIEGTGQTFLPWVNGANSIAVTLSTGDLTSYSGGRGGQADSSSPQGYGGGGGGATVLSLNGVVIGTAAGGGGGATYAPTNITYITTRYIATVGNPYNWPTAAPPAGTNGYIVDLLAVDYADVRRYEGIFWTIVINGTVVYAANREPPVTLAKPFGVGEIYPFENNPSSTYAKSVSNFEYISLNTSGITDRKFNGQNGQDVFGYANAGGGGGGGGGGARGGNGGSGGGGGGGFSGHNGTSLGETVMMPTGRLPYTNEYYSAGVAVGGVAGTPTQGGNGYIALVYQTGGGGSVYDGDEWKPVQQTYIKDSGIWKSVNTIYVNVNGIWKPIQGAPVPTFSVVGGAFGTVTRSFGAALVLPPPPPAPSYDYGGYTGYGSSDMF